jgi:hypothetical protein
MYIFTATEVKSCQMHQYKTYRLTPYSRQIQTPPYALPSLVYIYCYQSRRLQDFISISAASHELRTRRVKRDGHWLLY